MLVSLQDSSDVTSIPRAQQRFQAALRGLLPQLTSLSLEDADTPGSLVEALQPSHGLCRLCLKCSEIDVQVGFCLECHRCTVSICMYMKLSKTQNACLSTYVVGCHCGQTVRIRVCMCQHTFLPNLLARWTPCVHQNATHVQHLPCCHMYLACSAATTVRST